MAVEAPSIGGLADLYSFVDSIVNGYFTLSVVLASFLITFFIVLNSTRDQKGALLSGFFMSFFTSVMWYLALGNPIAVSTAILSLVGIIIAGRFL